MASEIRVNQIQNRSGLSTVTFSDTGVVIAGVTTVGILSATGNSVFSGSVNVSGTISGNVSASGVSTFETLRATNIVGVSTAGITTAYISSVNDGPISGARNRIINGNFDIWQRGTSFASPINAAYTADRWQVAFDGTGATRTISRQSFTVGQTDVPGEPTYFARFAQSAAGTGATFNQFDQRIEGVRAFAGQQVTISFWAKAAANTTMPGVSFQQLFGTGGSPSSLVSITAGSNLALTTTWQKFSYQVSIPSISGKTLGTDNNSSLIAVLTVPLNATFTIDIAQVQVEPGTVATPFEQRSIGQELALCQRYFVSTRTSSQFGLGLITGPAVTTSRVIVQNTLFPTVMRATPTVTVYSATADTSGAVALYNSLNAAVGSGFGISAPSSNGLGNTCNGSASLTVGNYYSFTYEASAEL